MGPDDTGATTDLDALIGEIRQEAARRRAAPDFPIDEEAGLAVDMDRQGPAGPGGADLPAITAALRGVERDRNGKTGRQKERKEDRTDDRRIAEVAGLAASAINALSVRLAQLERQIVPGLTPTPEPAATDAPDLVATWLDAIPVPPAGRVLVAGEGAAAWVDSLTAAGHDGYGVDPTGEPFGDEGVVRSGPVLEHLRTVADGALALALVVGPLGAAEAGRLEDLAGELARVTATVAVCAEAPWAWRRRTGDAEADTSRSWPVGPEAWMAALSRVGFDPIGRYGPGGRTFLATAAHPDHPAHPANPANPAHPTKATG